MRKCEVTLKKNAKPIPAKFHTWTNSMSTGTVSALVELEDGWCKEVRPDAVHFLDTNGKKLVVKTVDNPYKVLQVSTMLKNNDGYCPCRMEHSPDTKCMCKQFREQTEPGTCHCGLYEKVWKED